jgi:antitoxin component YwqK of YwqJK toxin-antitoxin module
MIKKLLPLILLILIGCSKNGVYTENYDNGHTEVTTYKNGIKEGRSTYYYRDYGIGRDKEEVIYKNGVKEGVSTYYHSNGFVKHTITYKNGVKEGPYNYYFDRSSLPKDSLDWVREYGVTESEFWSKSEREEGTYKNGVKEGPYVYYRPSNTFNNSSGSRTEGTYKNDVKEGPFVYYFSGHWKGHRIEGTHKNDVKEGPYVYYFSDGSIGEEGTYKNGERVKK